MSDDFWDGFDFPSSDVAGTDKIVSNTTAPTPDIESIDIDLKKRAMVVFFIVDISGSMKGNRIQAVNDAIRNLIPELKKRESKNTNAEIRIAILEFSSNASWRTLEPVPVSSFIYNDITYVNGGTNFGKAFAALNLKLSKDSFLKSSAGSYTPLIILLTDGKPSDPALYHEELDKLKSNSWFKYATKAGIALEEGALSPECRKILLEFTGNESMVLLASNTNILAKQIQLVTLTGVDFVTQCGSVQNNVSKASLLKEKHAMPSSVATENKETNTVIKQSLINSPSVIDPAGGADPQIPALKEIDWENDFPTFG